MLEIKKLDEHDCPDCRKDFYVVVDEEVERCPYCGCKTPEFTEELEAAFEL